MESLRVDTQTSRIVIASGGTEPKRKARKKSPGAQMAEDLEKASLTDILDWFQAVKKANTLLSIEFDTIDSYLFLLRACSMALRPAGRSAMLYLCAKEQATHKIQSSGPLELRLPNTPKLLGVLRKVWSPEAFCVSFKLETDESILLKKARGAIEHYGMDAVVVSCRRSDFAQANELKTRKNKVMLVLKSSVDAIERKHDTDPEIEKALIAKLATMHQHHRGAAKDSHAPTSSSKPRGRKRARASL